MRSFAFLALGVHGKNAFVFATRRIFFTRLSSNEIRVTLLIYKGISPFPCFEIGKQCTLFCKTHDSLHLFVFAVYLDRSGEVWKYTIGEWQIQNQDQAAPRSIIKPIDCSTLSIGYFFIRLGCQSIDHSTQSISQSITIARKPRIPSIL
jgi:hypothetical protein